MLYVNKKLTNNMYEIYDTDDMSYNILDENDVLRLNKHHKILGVGFDNSIKPIDPFKLFNRWRVLGTVEQNLKGTLIEKFFGILYEQFYVTNSDTTNNISLKLNSFKDKELKFKDIVIPEGIAILGEELCYNSSNLETVKLPNSVKGIDEGAFYNCTSLKSIRLSDNLIKICSNCFHNCISLKTVSLPNTVKQIGNYAFENCSSLEKLCIPESVSAVGKDCFMGCLNLKELVIPDNFTILTLFAHKCKGCENLEVIRTHSNSKIYNYKTGRYVK